MLGLDVRPGEKPRVAGMRTKDRVADMTGEQLRVIIGEVVEEKLSELLGDPDQGLALRNAFRTRLLRQKHAVADGERGESLESVAKRLGSA
jgi:hypothetical protein